MSFSSTTKDRFALAAICLSSLMFGLEISSVPVILPALETMLRGTFKDMQWIMNAYTIACTTVLMATGTLADRYGRRRMFVFSLLLFGITSALCGLARAVPVLIAGRFLQGMAGGAMLICQLAILSHQFPSGAARSRAFGAWGIIFGIGLGFGPIIGSGIVALWNWRWVFLVHSPIAILTLALTLSGVRESRDTQKRRLDWAGIILLSPAVLGITYFITQGPSSGLTSAVSLGSLLVAGICFILFLLAELRLADPMFDFSVFRIRNFSGALLGSMGMNFSFWPFMIYLPLLFRNGLHYSNVTAGFALLSYTLPTLVMPPVGERIAARYRPGAAIPFGLFTIGSGFFLMYWGSSVPDASWLSMLPGCLLSGIGLGLTNTPVSNTTTGSVTSDRAGMASGIDMSARLITLAVNIALMGLILVQGTLFGLRHACPNASSSSILRSLAEGIAAGTLNSGQNVELPEVSGTVAQAALLHGFGWVLLYGGFGVWLLAAGSYLVFRQREAVLQSVCANEV